jgi:hypothetical protein
VYGTGAQYTQGLEAVDKAANLNFLFQNGFLFSLADIKSPSKK